MKRLPSNIQKIIGYLISTGVSKLSMFLVLPVISSYLSPEEFGKWSVFNTIFFFAIPLTGLMMRTQISRLFFKLSSDELRKMTSTILCLNFVFSALSLVFVIAVNSYSDKVFGIESFYFYLFPILLFINNIKEITLLILRFKKNVKLFSFLEVSQALINIFFILGFIHFNHLRWELMIYAFSISLLSCSLISTIYLLKQKLLSFYFDKEVAISCLKVGLPLVPHAISAVVISLSDRLIVENMLGLKFVGLYSIAYMLGSSINIISNSFNKVWGPWIMENLSKDFNFAKKIKVVRMTYLYSLALFLCSFLFVAAIYIYINQFLDENYTDSFVIAIWVTGGMFFQGLYFSIFHYVTYLGKTKVFAYLTGFSACLNILANILLIPYYGAIGAAQATLLSYFSVFIILLFYTQRHMQLPWIKAFYRNKGISV